MSEIGKFFDENGYYHAKGLYTKNTLVDLEESFDQIVTQLTRSGEDINARWQGEAQEKIENGIRTSIVHTHNVQQFSATWLRALLHPPMLDVSEQILGPDIILHHTKLFQKPAENGSPFPMHQDWSYFPTQKDSMIAAIVHVSEATDEMGCLRVFPGSHKLGRLDNSNGQGASELDAYPIAEALPVECEAGDVVFFHYFTIHGSMPNRSNAVRKTVLFQLHAGDDLMEAREPGREHAYERLTLRGFNRGMSRSTAGSVKQ